MSFTSKAKFSPPGFPALINAGFPALIAILESSQAKHQTMLVKMLIDSNNTLLIVLWRVQYWYFSLHTKQVGLEQVGLNVSFLWIYICTEVMSMVFLSH